MCVREKIKEMKYTIIFVLCILISAGLCLDMALKSRGSASEDFTQETPYTEELPYVENGEEYQYEPGGGDEVVILNEADVQKMIVKELPPDFPLKGIGITLKEAKKVFLAGTIDREELRTYIDKCGIKLDSYMEMMLSLLPRTINVKAEFDIGTSADGGLLILSPRKIDAAGVNLPDGLLPQEFFDGLNESINRSLVSSGYLFKGINVKNGSIELMP